MQAKAPRKRRARVKTSDEVDGSAPQVTTVGKGEREGGVRGREREGRGRGRDVLSHRAARPCRPRAPGRGEQGGKHRTMRMGVLLK